MSTLQHLGLTFIGPTDWINDIPGRVDNVFNAPRGNELVHGCQGLRFTNTRDVDYPATTGGGINGIYAFEKLIVEKKWYEATLRVYSFLSEVCKKRQFWLIKMLANDLSRGVPAITAADEFNRKKQPVNANDSNYLYAKGMKPIDTSQGFPNGSFFIELLDIFKPGFDHSDPPSIPPKALIQKADYLSAADKERGFYIILRRMGPRLKAGVGTNAVGVTIHCNENWDDIISKTGETPSTILAHEMIHAYHSINGVGFHNLPMEEAQTVGIYPYEYKELTENWFRVKIREETRTEGRTWKTDRLRTHYGRSSDRRGAKTFQD